MTTNGSGLLAWLLLPQATDEPGIEPGPARSSADADVRASRHALGGGLRMLADELRKPRPPVTQSEQQAAEPGRSPLQAADQAVTAFGDRLRSSQVQASARRAQRHVMAPSHAAAPTPDSVMAP